RPVVTQGRALPLDPDPERASDPAADLGDRVGVQLARRPPWMDSRVPERLVRVDVPEPGDRPLIEKRCLDGGASPCQSPRELPRREAPAERLLAEARPQ